MIILFLTGVLTYLLIGYGLLGILSEEGWLPLSYKGGFEERVFITAFGVPYLIMCGVLHIYLKYKKEL
jgi:hypothetical protein